jgi:hypothetical protein
MRRSILFCSSVLAMFLVPGAASAQAIARHREVPLSQALHGPAKEAYTSATLLYNNGDFAGAAAKYEQAHALASDPRLLFDVAICEKNLRAYARMQKYLQEYEADAGTGISPDGKAAADAALAATQNLVGTLTIRTSVSGATVIVDGEPAGTTPLETPIVIDLGKHAITLQMTGFQPVHTTVEISGGTPSNVSLALRPEVHTGQISIVAEPGATIAIDGRAVATERFDGTIDAGPHEVRVSAPDKVVYRAEVDLHEGETRTLQVTLSNEKRGGSVWPWVAGGAAVAAGAAVGGYFLFKPSDRTADVPAGKLLSVSLSAWRER